MRIASFAESGLNVAVRLSRAGGVATFDFGGIVTDAGLAGSRLALAKAIAGVADGFVTRMERVVMCTRRPDWGMRDGGNTPMPKPGAIVVRSDCEDVANVYAGMMREKGFPRRAFTDPVAAAAWVADQVELQQAQARWWRARSAPSVQ